MGAAEEAEEAAASRNHRCSLAGGSRAGIVASGRCRLEPFVDRQQLEFPQFASREDEGCEVDCVQGAKRSPVGDLACHLTDAAADLSQFAPGPDRRDVSLGIGEPVLLSDTKCTQPDKRPARLHQ